MNLSTKAKQCALAARPESKLVRVGDHWAVVWRENRDFVGQAINRFVEPDQVWWAPEQRSRTKKNLVKLLLEDA